MQITIDDAEVQLLKDVLEDVIDCKCGKKDCKRDQLIAAPLLTKLEDDATV